METNPVYLVSDQIFGYGPGQTTIYHFKADKIEAVLIACGA